VRRLRINDSCWGVCPLLGESLFVWVQGCPRRCPGCLNDSALDFNGPAQEIAPEELALEWVSRRGGLVLSGGEPFSQAGGLAQLCRKIREIDSHARILTYTGYVLEELLREPREDWMALLKATDVLVDGPFLSNRRSDAMLFGSDNQRVFFLSDRVPRGRLNQPAGGHIHLSVAPSRQLRVVGTGSARVDVHDLMGRFRKEGLVLEEQ
jgi:anaerobic ribonucleoside-triphosphate reductase activating protein